MKHLLNTWNNCMEVDAFQKEFVVKDAVRALAHAWDDVTPFT